MISIITPVLNGEKFIEKNIKSILLLKIDFEHIIVDGGSSDSTLDIIKRYPHLKLIKQVDKKGMYSAISQGFELAKFKYLTWVNSDDIIIAENYENALEFAIANNIDFVYGDSYFDFTANNKLKYVKGNRFGKFFLKFYVLPFVQPSSFYKKELYLKHKINYTSFKISGDLDFFSRVFKSDNLQYFYLNKPLSIFLKYGDSLGDRNENLYKIEYSNFKIPKFIFFIKILFKLSKYI